jgi:hypothetical protein
MLTAPDGSKETIPNTGGSYVLRALRSAGKHELSAGKEKRAIYASVLNEAESDVAPRAKLELGRMTAKATPGAMRTADTWRWVGLLALVALAGEWVLFTRRS